MNGSLIDRSLKWTVRILFISSRIREVLLTGIRKRSLLAGFNLDRFGFHRSRGVVAAGRQREGGEGDKR